MSNDPERLQVQCPECETANVVIETRADDLEQLRELLIGFLRKAHENGEHGGGDA